MSHTFATLDVSPSAYKEIADKLRNAGYSHALGAGGEIDMHGIALTKEEEPPETAVFTRPECPFCYCDQKDGGVCRAGGRCRHAEPIVCPGVK